MKTATLKCIILGHKNLSDKDKLVFLYNEELGKLRVIAKGARRITSKFTGHLETLNFCTANLYFGPKNIILTEISTDKIHLRKRNNLQTITRALQIAEITNKMLYENQTLEALTDLIKQTLKHLTSSPKKSLIFTAYIIKLLDKSGTIPDFKTTKVSLEKKYVKFFNFIKNESFPEIKKISLTKKETQYILSITANLIEKEIGQTVNLLPHLSNPQIQPARDSKNPKDGTMTYV